MKIANFSFEIVINRKKEIWTNFSGSWKQIIGENEDAFRTIYSIAKQKGFASEAKTKLISDILHKSDLSTDRLESNETTGSIDIEKIKEAIQKLINFFSEFEFEPNFRFINCLANTSKTSVKASRDYVKNYFLLTDSQFAEAIIEKTKSIEFSEIISTFKEFNITKKINNRFRLYYGSQGTGKTTAAMKETNSNCIVCHSAMLPSDLMEDFKFVDGKATFIPSALQTAIVEGLPITLDEINLLPFESLRFLQSILDGKSQFEYKGKTIVIKDGFKIYGTMNLIVNGNVYALPEPLVDRAEELRNYKLDAEHLIGAFI